MTIVTGGSHQIVDLGAQFLGDDTREAKPDKGLGGGKCCNGIGSTKIGIGNTKIDIGITKNEKPGTRIA
ncbi:MAG: hypothetical protein HUU55_10780 [Myxococcales bacterium]|nr:hypothetical protein [Myxococcales bacterium]